MPGYNKSVQKRIRQNIKRHSANKALRNQIRTCVRNLYEAKENNNKKEAEETIKKYFSLLDRAIKKNIIHKNNGSRRKSIATRVFKSIKEEKKENQEENA